MKQTEEDKTKKNWISRRWKLLVLSLFALVLILIIAIPYLYSNRIFQPIIKETFRQLTHDKYHLDFKNVSWNILKSSFSLNKIYIIPTKGDTTTPLKGNTIEVLKLDQIVIKGIDYSSFFTGELKFRYLGLDGLDVLINNKKAIDSVDHPAGSQKIISDLLFSILVETIDVKHLNASYLVGNDSLIVVRDAAFSIDNFYLDSLNYQITYRIPSFENINISLGQTEYLAKHSKLLLSNFLFSAGQQLEKPNIVFSKLELINNDNRNTTQFNNGLIEVELKDFFPSLKMGDFKIPKASFRFRSLQNRVEVQKKVDINRLLENVQAELEKTKTNLILDTLLLEIDTIIHHTPKQLLKLVNLQYALIDAQIINHRYHYSTYSLASGNVVYESVNEKDKLLLQSFEYQKRAGDLILNNISYKDSISSISFNLEKAKLHRFYPLYTLQNHQFIVDELQLFYPKLIISEHHVSRQKSVSNQINWEVDIKHLEIAHLDLELEQLGLTLDNCGLIVDSLQIPADTVIVWPQTLKSFDIVFDRIRYDSPDEKLNALVENTHFQSLNGRLNTSQLQVFIDKPDTANSMSIKAKHILLDGIDWQTLWKTKSPIILDSLVLSSLIVNGSVDKASSNYKMAVDSLFYFSCKYINLPSIQLNIAMNLQEQSTSINLNNLGIYARNFSFDWSDDELLNYSDLKLSSIESSYWSAANSNLFQLSKWNLDMKKQLFIAHGFNMDIHYSDSLKQTKGNVKFQLPSVYISGVDPMDFYLRRAIELDSVNISKPNLKLQGERNSKIEYKGESQSFYEAFRQMVAKFSVISFNHFMVSNFKIDIENRYIDRCDKLGIDKIDLGVHGFYLDYTSLNNMQKFLFSDEISLKVSDYSQSINNGQYIVSLKESGVSNVNNRLYFKELQLMSLGNYGGTPINIFVSDILFKDFNLLPQIDRPALRIGSVMFHSAIFQIRNQKNKHAKKFNLEELNLFPLISQQLSAISIGQLEFADMDMNISGLQIGDQKGVSLSGIQLYAEDLHLDSNNRIFTYDKFLYCDDVKLDLPSFQFKTSDRFYNIGFRKLSFSSRNKHLIFDSISVVPTYDKKTFTANITYQKDRVELLIPKMSIDQLDFRDMIFRERYKAQKITLVEPDISFYKDKTIAADTTLYKAMPARVLADLPFYLSIDTVEILDGKLQYEELSTNMLQTGLIYFDHLNSQVTGISNDADLRNFGGALKLTANTRVMSKSMLTLHTVFPLNSPNQEFIMIASMGSIWASEFNPIMQPLSLISAKDGKIEQMQMNVRANEDYGVGEMILKYSDLKVDVLKKKNLKESQLVSFLANTIFLKTNNNSLFGPRKGPIYFERNKHRGVINYLAHFAIMGAKTSVGIDNRKAKRKIKSLNEKAK